MITKTPSSTNDDNDMSFSFVSQASGLKEKSNITLQLLTCLPEADVRYLYVVGKYSTR